MSGQLRRPDENDCNEANNSSNRSGDNRTDDSNESAANGSRNASVSSSSYLTMSKTESMKLLRLLTEWNMPYLHETCVDSLIDVEALEYINPLQCEALLNRFPMGVRIKFVGKLVVWKTKLHNYQMSLNNYNRDYGHH